MAFNKKEDRDNIEKFNSLAGMSHRNKPYDLKKPKDIIEAVIIDSFAKQLKIILLQIKNNR